MVALDVNMMNRVAVCIPTVGKCGDMLRELVAVCLEEESVCKVELWDNSLDGALGDDWPIDEKPLDIFYAPDMTIYQEWNWFARYWNNHADMAFLNDDIEMAPGTLNRLTEAMIDYRLLSVAPNPNEALVGDSRAVREVAGTYRQGGICGWAFMVQQGCWPCDGVDERFEVWYGDDDLVWKMRRDTRPVGVLEGVSVRHEQSTTVNSLPWCQEAMVRDQKLWRKLGRA